MRALRGQPRPPQSDIADMEAILRERYGDHLWHLELTNELRRAARLGYEPREGDQITVEGLRAWIAEHGPAEGENVIALFDPEPGAPTEQGGGG